MFKLDTPTHPWHPCEGLYPIAMIQMTRRVITLGYGCIIGSLLLFLVMAELLPPDGMLNPVTIAFFLPMAVILSMNWFLFRRLRAHAKRNDHALCLTCSQPLDAQGHCSSCDRTHELEQVQWAWKRACQIPVPSTPPGPSSGIGLDDLDDTRRRDLIKTHPARFAMTRTFIPNACRRAIFPWLWCFLILGLLIDVAAMVFRPFFVSGQSPVNTTFMMLESLVFLALVIIFSIYMHLSIKGWKIRADNADDMLCLACGQSLHGQEELGQCPECGLPYSREGTRSIWNTFRRTANPLYTSRRKSQVND